MLPEPKTNHDSRFDVCFEQGRRGEQWVTALGSEHWMEVKVDTLWARTGKLFFEFSSRGKPSGIAVTQASYWTVVLWAKEGRAGCLTFEVRNLKRNLKRMLKLNMAQRTFGGDDGTSEGVLVPLSEIQYLWRTTDD